MSWCARLCSGGIVAADATVADDDGNGDDADTVIMAFAIWILYIFRRLSALMPSCVNRRFPEITGKDNLTVFSYSGRVKSPEWRRQLGRADTLRCSGMDLL